MADSPEDRPPILGSWRAMYGFVLLTLALLIVLMSLGTWALR